MEEYDKKWCLGIVNEVKKWSIATPFLRPVDPVRDGCPDYLSVIEKPMDFTKIEHQINSGKYRSVEDFMSDLKLIADNVIKYNTAESVYAYFCEDILQYVQKKYSEKPRNAEDEWFKELVKTNVLLNEHLRHVPRAICRMSSRRMPKIDMKTLTATQVSLIEQELGRCSVADLKKKWDLLNSKTQAKVRSFLNM